MLYRKKYRLKVGKKLQQWSKLRGGHKIQMATGGEKSMECSMYENIGKNREKIDSFFKKGEKR